MQACDRCHRRKSKCDKQVPVCGPCMKAGASCVYTDRSKEPTYRKEVVERLERRLKQAEATNRALAARLASTGLAAAHTDGNAEEDPSAVSGIATAHTPDRQLGPGPRPDGGNEVTDEVSFLSLTAGGERQFLGSGSGVLFANLVRSTVEATSESSPTPAAAAAATATAATATSTPAAMAPRKRDYPTAFYSDGLFAPGSRSSLSSLTKTDYSQLPPEAFARDLHHAYFEHDHLCYPFLHRPTVLSAFEQIYRDPSYLDRDASAYFVFYMIMAISSVDYHKFDWQTRPDAENFHGMALSRLNDVLQSRGIKALQAILLLCQYRMRSSIQDTSASMWHLVGIAARICFELGLHREPLYQVREERDHHGAHADSFVRAEIRRRCFFCVLAIDRVVSVTLGRPFAIHLEDVDVALPDPQYDLDVNPTDSSFHPTSTETFSRTALFVHIVRYRILCGKVLVSLHSGVRTISKADEPSVVALRDHLAAELDDWRHGTSALHLPAVDLSNAIPGDRSSFRAHEWYELLYHNALLMLYRPSPALSATNPKIPTSIQSIFTAAKQSITLYAHLHRSRRINYTWITLHAVFMAGLSYVYAVGRHFRAKRRGFKPGHGVVPMLDEDPTIIEIVNETRACSNVLVAVSERWSDSRNSHEVFHRLSDAVLVDAIELLNSPSNQSVTPATQVGSVETVPPVTAAEGVSNTSLESWSSHDISNPQLAVDSVLRDCFQDLQHMHEHSCGDDPIGRLSQDWLCEIGGIALEAAQVWGE